MDYDTKDYYKRIGDYELRCQRLSKVDIPFWYELIKRHKPARVLELACGSGRIGIELLHEQDTFFLEGLDIDENMLAAYHDKLNSKTESIKQRVTLHQGDMSDYQLANKGEFDLIFVPCNSIGHLLEIKQHLDIFRRTYEHLAPGGRFVVDIFLPMNRGDAGPVIYSDEVIDIPGSKSQMVAYSSYRHNCHEQTSYMATIYEKFLEDGSNERYLVQLKTHTFYPNELKILFLSTGFEIEAIYGDYSWVPFEQGTRQIFIGYRRE